MKKCFKCGETKDYSEFYRHKQMADGHLNKCKSCAKKDVSANYRENIDHYKEYDKGRANAPHRVSARKAYSLTPQGRSTGSKAKKRWLDSNPIKKAASQMVRNAIRSGKLTKPEKCEQCPNTERLHGHHDDYAYPLSVRWLCPKCHKDWHKENGEGLNAN